MAIIITITNEKSETFSKLEKTYKAKVAMRSLISRFFGFFVADLVDFPRETREKMRYLSYLCVGGIGLYGYILIRSLTFQIDSFAAIASTYALTLCILTLELIRKGKPVVAGNCAITILFYILISIPLRDAFTSNFYQISRLNDTAVELILGVVTISGYVIRKTQYIFVIGAVCSIITAHFLILVFRDYGGIFADSNVTPFIATVSILIITFVSSFQILTLTRRKWGEIFTNIIFYKLARAGPAVIYVEHPLEEEMEIAYGVHFYATIGQGHRYATGLFGPIPFDKYEMRTVALIHASMVLDTHQEDLRMRNQNYLIIALITSPEKAIIVNRRRLENGIESAISKISDLSNLAGDFWTSLAKQIRAI